MERFSLYPSTHPPALSAPKPKRKYKRGSNLSLSATMRENTSGDTTNSIIQGVPKVTHTLWNGVAQ